MHQFDEMTDPELKAHFDDLCDKVKDHLPEDTGFMVFAAPFNKETSIAQYASNVERDDAVKFMQETLTRWNEMVPRG